MTVEFRQSRGGPVVTALMADASLGDIGTAYPWRTFRWYMGQKHYSGWYWSTTDQQQVRRDRIRRHPMSQSTCLRTLFVALPVTQRSSTPSYPSCKRCRQDKFATTK